MPSLSQIAFKVLVVSKLNGDKVSFFCDHSWASLIHPFLKIKYPRYIFATSNTMPRINTITIIKTMGMLCNMVSFANAMPVNALYIVSTDNQLCTVEKKPVPWLRQYSVLTYHL